MTQEEFEKTIEDAAKAFVEANKAWIDAISNAVDKAQESDLDVNRCMIAVAYHGKLVEKAVEEMSKDD